MKRFLIVAVLGFTSAFSSYSTSEAQLFRSRRNNCPCPQATYRQSFVPQSTRVLFLVSPAARNAALNNQQVWQSRQQAQSQYSIANPRGADNSTQPLVVPRETFSASPSPGQPPFIPGTVVTPTLAAEPGVVTSDGVTLEQPADVQPATFDAPVENAAPVIEPPADQPKVIEAPAAQAPVIEAPAAQPQIIEAPGAETAPQENSILDKAN